MIQEKLDSYLLNQEKMKENRKRSGLWSPSSFGRCYRYQYWNRANEPKTNPIDAQTLRVFKVGNLVHQFFQDILKEDGYFVEVMVKTGDTLGYADLVNINEVVDIKTVKSYQFKLMRDKKKKYDFKSEKANEILQVTFYGKNLGKERGRLIFVDKDKLDMIEFEFDIKEFEEKLKEEIEILNNFWNQQKLPPALPRCYNGNECSYCSFQTKCKGDKNVTSTKDR